MPKLRLVIADDEVIIRMDIREILEDAGHMVVGEAGNGKRAIDLVQTAKPDLVLLDVKMPVLDGIEATKAITDLGYPVLLLTAFNQLQMVERAKKVGAINYLVKPVSERELLPAIEMAFALHQRIASLHQEVATARTALIQRKIIEKACAAYACSLRISHDAGYRRMAKLAMDKNKPLYQVADEILKLLSRKERSFKTGPRASSL